MAPARAGGAAAARHDRRRVDHCGRPAALDPTGATSSPTAWGRLSVEQLADLPPAESEAAYVFVEVPEQGFVIDTTVVRRGSLLLFISVLNSEGGSRPEIGVRVADLVLQNAADMGG